MTPTRPGPRELAAGGRLSAHRHCWFGFEARDDRSWSVPLLHAIDAGGRASATGLEHRLDDLAPAAVLVDRKTREQFEYHPDIELFVAPPELER
jgi:hypothetical protein